MKVIKKKNKPLLIGIMALVLALLITAAILLPILLNVEEEPEVKEPITLMPGEAYIGDNSPATYSPVGENKFMLIAIDGKECAYTLMRPDKSVQTVEVKDKDGNPVLNEDGTKKTEKVSYDVFTFYYEDEYGELQAYYPSINEADPTFEYTDLYATEENSLGFTLDKVTYLTSALGSIYFEERIVLPVITDTMTDAERAAAEAELLTQYERYGFEAGGDAVRVRFKYINENDEMAYHTVVIGDKLISQKGYYLMVDERPYIYSVNNVEMLRYAFADLVEYIKPVLTAAGLEIDGLFEPLLTTDYKQYVNTVHKGDGCKEKGCEGGCTVVASNTDRVVIDAQTRLPFETDKENEKYQSGYQTGDYKSTMVDLDKIAKDDAYRSLVSVLMGKGAGLFANPVQVTLSSSSSSSKRLELLEGVSKTYTYTIYEVEAILTDGADVTAAGTAVGAADRIVVRYTLSVDGVARSIYPMHAVLDMSSAAIPAEVKSELTAIGTVGGADGVSFSVQYSADTAIKREIKMIATDVIDIVDSNNKSVDKATNGTTVVYRYYLSLDGEKIAEDLSDAVEIKDGLTGEAKRIADLFRGKGREKDFMLELGSFTGYFEAFSEFITYSIKGIKYIVRPEPVVSFEFEQASERDPFYGDSLYKNTLENSNRIYALNSTVCGLVAEMLGGSGSSTTTSAGLIGLKTVDIGITPDKLEKYGLYAHTIYFEMPRGITGVEYDESKHGSVNNYLDTLDDYDFYSTLGFTLYVSEKNIDGTRYIASELYDIIATVEADDFLFLDYDFVEFYARRNLLLTNVTNIKNVSFDFFMEDIYGSYSNELTHKALYAYGGKIVEKSQLTEEQLQYASNYDGIFIYTKPSGECSDTKYLGYYNSLMTTLKVDGVDYGGALFPFYDSKYIELDTLATSNFKEMLETIFYTQYVDNLTKDEQEQAFADGKLLMKMTVTLGEAYGEDETSHADKFKTGIYKATSSYDYAYEFYRASDRRIMVRIFREDRATGTALESVSDFYISTYAFKKIVNCYMQILAGQTVDNEMSYPENAK